MTTGDLRANLMHLRHLVNSEQHKRASDLIDSLLETTVDGYVTPPVCTGSGTIPPTLQGVTSMSSTGFAPQACGICGQRTVVDGIMRLVVHPSGAFGRDHITRSTEALDTIAAWRALSDEQRSVTLEWLDEWHGNAAEPACDVAIAALRALAKEPLRMKP